MMIGPWARARPGARKIAATRPTKTIFRIIPSFRKCAETGFSCFLSSGSKPAVEQLDLSRIGCTNCRGTSPKADVFGSFVRSHPPDRSVSALTLRDDKQPPEWKQRLTARIPRVGLCDAFTVGRFEGCFVVALKDVQVPRQPCALGPFLDGVIALKNLQVFRLPNVDVFR